MSIIKLDLRSIPSPNNSLKQSPSPGAPLVKINLNPENNVQEEQQNMSGNTIGTCNISALTSSVQMNSLTMSVPQQFAHSMNLMGNSITNILNSGQPAVFSPCQAKLNKNLLSVISKKERKISDNSTEVSHEESQHLHFSLMQRKLEQSQIENQEMRSSLAKEKVKNQLLISENLSVKEELRKAQHRLKEYETLSNMRNINSMKHPQVNSPHIHKSRSQQMKKQIIQQQQRPGTVEKTPELSYEMSFFKNQDEKPQEFNQLSQRSILDILHSLDQEEHEILVAQDSFDKEITPSIKTNAVRLAKSQTFTPLPNKRSHYASKQFTRLSSNLAYCPKILS